MKTVYQPQAVERGSITKVDFQGARSTITSYFGVVMQRFQWEPGEISPARALGALPYAIKVDESGPLGSSAEAFQWAEDRICELEAEAELRASGSDGAADLCRGLLTGPKPRDPLYNLVRS